MKIVEISSELYQISITYANAVYSILTTPDTWCTDAWELKQSLINGSYNV